MNEKRRLPRKRADLPLQVADTMTGDVIGRLGDASREGLLLIAHTPITEDALYQLRFHLPDAHGRLHPVEVGVHQTWSEKTSTAGQSWVGFRFIDIGAEGEGVLHGWLQQATDSAR